MADQRGPNGAGEAQGVDGGPFGLEDGEGLVDGGLQAADGVGQAEGVEEADGRAVVHDGPGGRDGVVKLCEGRGDARGRAGVEGVLDRVDVVADVGEGGVDGADLRACQPEDAGDGD